METAGQTRIPSARNRGLKADEIDSSLYQSRLHTPADRPGADRPVGLADLADLAGHTDRGMLFHQDALEVLPLLPEATVDLVIADPPYNMHKDFHGLKTAPRTWDQYAAFLESWLVPLKRLLKPGASLYVCGDWRSSGPLQQVLERHFIVRNRITWEREKGRSSASNWKNASEDIWFCTLGDEYVFDAAAVRLRRRVRAPYRSGGSPKDWSEAEEGLRWRDTGGSNFWSDITVPFWSMPENTPHPTQKPEKLVAKLMMASSRLGDLVLDPFMGSGTTAVCARKLGRRWLGMEINRDYCAWTLARLDRAALDTRIQGYESGIFFERNFARVQEGSCGKGGEEI